MSDNFSNDNQETIIVPGAWQTESGIKGPNIKEDNESSQLENVKEAEQAEQTEQTETVLENTLEQTKDNCSTDSDESQNTPTLTEMTPTEVVEALDRFIIGQNKAKRAVAVALRNRYRRELLHEDLRDEVVPKNILMVGPTGVGKTEIARRLARLANAPFLKVEASKYTEVGYVGRDVESMIRELTDIAVRMVEAENYERVYDKAVEMAVDRLVEIMLPGKETSSPNNPLQAMFAGIGGLGAGQQVSDKSEDDDLKTKRKELKEKITNAQVNDTQVELEVEDRSSHGVQVVSNVGVEEMGVNFQDLLGEFMPKRKKKCRLTVLEALKILTKEESSKLIDSEAVKREAIRRVECRGILFLDELDKIAGRENSQGPDVSREGVQRDILPIVEGSTVNTKHGSVKTDHILFIAAGAFHVSKPSDLIPELQGRFPLRVTLDSLTQDDFRRILVEPDNALTRQYKALLATEGVTIEFTEDGIDELAKIACEVNMQAENIGARRLHTILERVLEKVSFDAPEMKGQTVSIDRAFVQGELKDIVEDRDLSKFIL